MLWFLLKWQKYIEIMKLVLKMVSNTSKFREDEYVIWKSQWWLNLNFDYDFLISLDKFHR